MDKENIEYKIQIIKDAFDEKRNIIGYAPNEMIKVNEDCHQGGDIFITDENELIDTLANIHRQITEEREHQVRQRNDYLRNILII